MLLGQFASTIGEKHQTGLPKKFRDELGDSLIVTKGFEACLLVVSEENWKTLLEGTAGRPFISRDTRELQRFLLGNAAQVTLDNKGRFIVPEFLRSYAHLHDEIVYVGIERFVEIWDKNTWEKHQQELSGKIESIAEKLSQENKSD